MAFSSLFALHIRDITSEAEVETRLLARLFSDLGYPDLSVIPKKSVPSLNVSSGSSKHPVQVDFLLKSSRGAAKVLVEAKDPGESVATAWGQAASYALSYNRDKPQSDRIEWLLISNGHTTSLFRHDSDNASVTLNLTDFASGSPPYVALRSLIKYTAFEDAVATGGLFFESISPQKLNALFDECHNLVWKKEKLAPADAFFEFCKFVFLKIRADREREKNPATPSYALPMTLAWLEAQKQSTPHPVRDILFAKLRNDLEEAIQKGKKRIFDPNEQFRLSAQTSRELIKRFEHINLSSIDEDLNGRMFEVFLNAAVRGKDLGQFFTPRPLVDFMTRIALHRFREEMIPPRTIDACAGTAGFLIEVMAYLLASARSDTRLTPKERAEKEKLIKEGSLFGIEANERVSRIARINMYLHGDGGSYIFHGDGLDGDPTDTSDMSQERKNEVSDHKAKVIPQSFDLVLTNPPFSMTYTRANDDEERILRQLEIANREPSVKSNVLFLQRYHDLLKAGGEMLIVLDDTILNGSTQLGVRTWLLNHFVLLGIHSLPFNAFFKAKANIKTSVLHLRRKISPSDGQGHVFMSTSNNIGHDNSLKDTPERNNLNEILNAYYDWQRTGALNPVVRHNQDPHENLECPMQIWLTPPNELSLDRLDAFYYCPELKEVQERLTRNASDGIIEEAFGNRFTLRRRLSPAEKKELRESRENLRYIEIGDVTRYGLITKWIEGTFDTLPSRGDFRIRSGDVLMAINNSSRGTVVLVPPAFDGVICTSGFLVIEPTSDEEGHLLWYALRSEDCRKQIYYLAQTASQPEIKLDAWRTMFRVPIPAGAARSQAITKSREFQAHLAALLNADDVRFTSPEF